MKIKFKKSDPRAGLVVEFDSSRGQELVDAGAADIYKDGEHESKPAVEAESKSQKKKAK